MTLAFKRFKVYLRVGIAVAVILFGAIVLFKNRDHWVQVWFFGLTDPDKPTNVVWVMVWTAAITRTAWWLFSFTHGMIRDMRDLQRQEAITEVEASRRQREAKLDERERRIDEKLKQVEGGVPTGDDARPSGVDEGEAT